MYITLSEAQTLLGRLLDIYKDDNGVVDTDHLQLVIDEAEGMVNAAIASRYSIPVTDTNSVAFLRAIVVPILRYKTITQFAETEEVSEGIQLEYRKALETLYKLARQVMSLPGTSDKTSGRPAYIAITKSTDSLTGY